MLHVTGKLRRLHEALKANGGKSVSLADVAAPPDKLDEVLAMDDRIRAGLALGQQDAQAKALAACHGEREPVGRGALWLEHCA